MLANKEDWNKLVMAAKMVSDPNIQVKIAHTKSTYTSVNRQIAKNSFSIDIELLSDLFFRRNALNAILMLVNVQNTLNVMFNISPHLHV